MKKLLLILAATGFTLSGIAQDKYVVSALSALKENNLDEAKENIDKAMASPETKEKPKALFAKGQIYFSMQQVEKYSKSQPYKEATVALLKLAEVKADYEKETVDQLLLVSAYLYFNAGTEAYNNKLNDEAVDDMRNVVKIHDLGAGKRFEKSPYAKKFDTVAAQAKQTIATSVFFSGKYDEAIPLLVAAKNNPITKSEMTYQLLIDAYKSTNKNEDMLKTIEEGRKEFPKDVNLRNSELNYYIHAGKQEELAKKLEEASAKEPNNADIMFNLATCYEDMCNPKDGKRPANYSELFTKSEATFQKTIAISPENPAYNFNFGDLYFNEAVNYNEQMNNVGTTAADQKKYDELKIKRDGLFEKCTPMFEKVMSIYSTKANLKSNDDKLIYNNAMEALKKIYLLLDKKDKYEEIKKKSDEAGH